MSIIRTIADLKEIQKTCMAKVKMQDTPNGYRVLVGLATCGIAAGAKAVFEHLARLIEENHLSNVELVKVGCIGECALEPIVEVYDHDGHRTTYGKVNPDVAEKIIFEHVMGGHVLENQTTYYLRNKNRGANEKKIDFQGSQLRIALRNCGLIDPSKVSDYIGRDGYQALYKVLKEYTPEQVVEIMKQSGLRGRGGGGFSTGLKWELCAKNKAEQKYVICNADEGDPGAFMDRSVLEGDPHSVIEAMAIAGYAIGATQGYVYVRAEYPIAVETLQYAINDAKEHGLLGKNIFESGFDFDLEIRLGAGAFVCGEETALMASIEGERGMPRNKPPFPAEKGLWQKPSIINNVETFANVPVIIFKGADWFSSIGTEKSKGTKVFALGGKINNTGLVEIPMGTTLREVIYDIGGGIPNGKKFKAVQTGGPSGGCLTEKDLDTPIDYDNLIALGSMMGSGGMIVMDENNCMVDVARFFLDFTVDESCGKCTPCREGTRRMLEILKKITAGKGTMEDLDLLEKLAHIVKDTSLCGLGQSAPNPVLSTLKNFKNEYLAHVVDHECHAGVCKEMIHYNITDRCIGCGKCKRNCPVSCISGDVKKKHIIDVNKCIKCGTCKMACPVNAVEVH